VARWQARKLVVSVAKKSGRPSWNYLGFSVDVGLAANRQRQLAAA
jgi:hypothetical protein